MRIRNSNSNAWKSVKPISRINQNTLQQIDMMRIYNSSTLQRRMPLKITGGLALNLADNANKYSKMFTQEV